MSKNGATVAPRGRAGVVARMGPTCGAGSRGAITASEHGGFWRSEHAASVTRRGGSVALATHSPTRVGGSRAATVGSDARLLFAVSACNGRDAARGGPRVGWPDRHVQIALTIDRSAMWRDGGAVGATQIEVRPCRLQVAGRCSARVASSIERSEGRLVCAAPQRERENGVAIICNTGVKPELVASN